MYNYRVRMRKLHLILALGTALSTVAAASQSRVASVNFTFRETPLRGYRVGDEFLLPLENVADLGWTASSANAGAKIVAESRTFNIPTRQVEGKTCIPLRAAVDKVGGDSSWNPGGYDILQVSSPVFRVSVNKGVLNVDSAMAVKTTVSVIGSKKVVIDLDGAKFTRETKVDADGSTSVSQYGPNTVRIVLNLDFVPNLPKGQVSNSSQIKLDLSPEPVRPKEVATPKPDKTVPKQDDPPKTDQTTQNQTQNPTQNPVPTGPIDLPIAINWENETNTSMAIKFAPGQWVGTATCRKPEKNILELELSNLDGVLPKDFELKSKAIKEITAEKNGTSTILRLRLERAMGADITTSATGVVLNLVRPTSTGGRLDGKVIVLDAGHGGRDHGATAAGIMEKNINLFLSRYVRDALTAEGVTVIMTRNDDSFPELEARPALANKNSADIFLSIHVNEPGRGGGTTPSGTITFYHKGSAISKFLGECIQSEIVKSKLLPDMGVRSDGTIYQSGFAVLRLSNMPGVLIETGFITNPKDRQVLQSEAFGKALAKSVVAGLKTYYGQ